MKLENELHQDQIYGQKLSLLVQIPKIAEQHFAVRSMLGYAVSGLDLPAATWQTTDREIVNIVGLQTEILVLF